MICFQIKCSNIYGQLCLYSVETGNIVYLCLFICSVCNLHWLISEHLTILIEAIWCSTDLCLILSGLLYGLLSFRFRMSWIYMKEVLTVSAFPIEFCNKFVIFTTDLSIKKCDACLRYFSSKLDVIVFFVQVIPTVFELLFGTSSYEE